MLTLRFILLLVFRILKYAWLTVWTLYQLALGAILVVAVVSAFKIMAYFHIREIRSLRTHIPKTTTFMENERKDLRDSLTAAQLRGSKTLPDTVLRWEWVPLDSIPKTLIELALVAEDAKFYSHGGFDVEQIEYAIVANHQAGRQARGASTITQQVAKNLFLSGEREMSRKLREAVISLGMEEWLGKNRILELYLNIAQFGRGIFGVKAAAHAHFNKELSQLTQDEMLGLVCVLPTPERWTPKRQSTAYLSHKQQVLRNYALFKGLKSMADSSAQDWMRGIYDSLGTILAERRWNLLRSSSPVPWNDSGADSSAVKLESGE